MNKYKQVLKHFEIIYKLFLDVLNSLEAILKRFEQLENNWRTIGRETLKEEKSIPITTSFYSWSKSFINSPFFCSEFQSVSRIVKIVHSGCDDASPSLLKKFGASLKFDPKVSAQQIAITKILVACSICHYRY